MIRRWLQHVSIQFCDVLSGHALQSLTFYGESFIFLDSDLYWTFDFAYIRVSPLAVFWFCHCWDTCVRWCSVHCFFDVVGVFFQFRNPKWLRKYSVYIVNCLKDTRLLQKIVWVTLTMSDDEYSFKATIGLGCVDIYQISTLSSLIPKFAVNVITYHHESYC